MFRNYKYLLLLLPFFLLSLAEKKGVREFKIKGKAQGTTYAVSYFAKDSVVTKLQIDSILHVIDLSMSLYLPNSTINKFNVNKIVSIKIDSHMVNVLNKSFQINSETDGLFDITILPLMRLWGFYRQNGADYPVEPARLSAFLDREHGTTGMDKIKLKGDILSKANNHVEIDLDGIAQGYSVDVIADFIEAKGIKAYVAELGGEIRAKGPKPDGKPIKIGIERPPTVDLRENGLSHVITFSEGAVTTSGDYRKFIIFEGEKYGHTINPKTGYPSHGEIISVTVFAKRAIDADGYDNALMLMSVKNALKFAEDKKDIDAYFIYKKPNGQITDTLSTGFQRMIID